MELVIDRAKVEASISANTYVITGTTEINAYLLQECIPVGCVQSAAVAVCRMWGGGLSAQGNVCPEGVSAQGVYPSMH